MLYVKNKLKFKQYFKKGGRRVKKYFKYMKGNWKYAILAPILIMVDTAGTVSYTHLFKL